MNETFRRLLKEWILPFALEIVVIWVLFTYVINLTVVPSGSMIPTIAEGSVLVCTRVYNPEKLQRGDIVSFESQELEKRLIKRLIGLPGETVQVDEAGVVTIDGVPLEEPYVKNQLTDYPCTFTVPEGCYLFFGDNRSGSDDARLWDDPYIPGEAIVNKARFTLWPLSNFGTLK